MTSNKYWAKLLRSIGIILMGITAVFTIMSGVGTSCVALAAEKFGESMAPLAAYSWLYILFVLVTTAIGVMGARATVLLAKGRTNAYRQAVTALVLGTGIGVIHIIASRALRGKSMPTDAVAYTTVLTLIVFLIFRIPAIWKEVNFGRSEIKNNRRHAAAITLALCGISVLTAPAWGASSHIFTPGGFNWASAWPLQMNLSGIMLCLGGVGIAAAPAVRRVFGIGRQRQAEERLI